MRSITSTFQDAGLSRLGTGSEVKFDLKHFGDIERLAMVGDKRWEKFLGVFGRPLSGAEIRYFDLSFLPEARAWIERISV